MEETTPNEMTDDEIARVMGWSSFEQLDAVTYDNIEMRVLLLDVRKVIAADRAKRTGA